jgi:transposase
MSKPVHPNQASVFCGIDVSAATLAVAVQPQEQPLERRDFANNAAGHKALIAWLGRGQAMVRVSLEATGIYSLDLALSLDRAEGIEVAVLNPKLANRFAATLRRSKTDAAAAEVLAEYSRRMPFQPWCAPNRAALQLRSLSRHIDQLTVEQARTRNHLHAAQGSQATPRCVVQDLKRSLATVQRRLVRLRREAMRLVRQDEALGKQFDLLTGIPGIAEISALQLLGELGTLPAGMTVRQWVAHSGLDPAHEISGSSVHKPSRISRQGSRHLRRALYMPALVASRRDPHLKAFYETLLARHKARLQALVAVACKLLHAIYGILHTQTPYDGRKLFPALLPELKEKDPLWTPLKRKKCLPAKRESGAKAPLIMRCLRHGLIRALKQSGFFQQPLNPCP